MASYCLMYRKLLLGQGAQADSQNRNKEHLVLCSG